MVWYISGCTIKGVAKQHWLLKLAHQQLSIRVLILGRGDLDFRNHKTKPHLTIDLPPRLSLLGPAALNGLHETDSTACRQIESLDITVSSNHCACNIVLQITNFERVLFVRRHWKLGLHRKQNSFPRRNIKHITITACMDCSSRNQILAFWYCSWPFTGLHPECWCLQRTQMRFEGHFCIYNILLTDPSLSPCPYPSNMMTRNVFLFPEYEDPGKTSPKNS